jgi:hypothetical protein
VDEQPRGLDSESHVRQLGLDHLQLADRASEGLKTILRTCVLQRMYKNVF